MMAVAVSTRSAARVADADRQQSDARRPFSPLETRLRTH